MVSETEQVLVKESAEPAQRTNEMQKTMDKQQSQARWRQTEAQFRDMYESNSAQVQQFADSLFKSELKHKQLHIANEIRLQLEAQTLRMSHAMEQQILSIAREFETQQLQDKSASQPQLLKGQWKQQMSQTATYKAEIHALRTELANLTERPELQATLSAKMCSIKSPRLIIGAAPENLLNTVGPRRSPSWILPGQLMPQNDDRRKLQLERL